MGNAHPIDGRPQNEVQVGPNKLEVVASFCCLGDMLSAGEGCEIAVTTRVKTAWKKFRELLPVLTSSHLSYKTHGHVYNSCVRCRIACDIQIDGRRGAGRPKLTWKKLTERDCREWKLMKVDPQERST